MGSFAIALFMDQNIIPALLRKTALWKQGQLKKMPNAILPLVVLTWLRQLQEHFFELDDSKEAADWNRHGKYCAVGANHVPKDLPLNSVHMMKANSSEHEKINSFEYIKPNAANNKLAVKSLEEWASNILHWDNNDYVINIAKTDKEMIKRIK